MAGPEADAPLLWSLAGIGNGLCWGWRSVVLKHLISQMAPIGKSFQEHLMRIRRWCLGLVGRPR